MELHKLIAEVRQTYFSSKRIALFVAAGISKDCPTHLPLGEELKMAVLLGFFEEIKTTIDLTLLEKAVESRSLEEVCGVIQGQLCNKGRLIADMAQALDNDQVMPNRNHYFLAKSLREGHLVVTTNYDAMVEVAYRRLYYSDFPDERICFDEASFAKFMERSSILRRTRNDLGWLLKLHGTFRIGKKSAGNSVMTTLNRVGQGLPPKVVQALIQVLRRCPLVVLGYGCMDIDIVPVLRDTISKEPIWWIRHTDGGIEILGHKDLRDALNREEEKSEGHRDVRTGNIGRLLSDRGSKNGGRVWQIKAPTSQVVSALTQQVGEDRRVMGACNCREKERVEGGVASSWASEFRYRETTCPCQAGPDLWAI